MSHKVIREFEHNNTIILYTDPETGKITKEYFISNEELESVIQQLQEAAEKNNFEKLGVI